MLFTTSDHAVGYVNVIAKTIFILFFSALCILPFKLIKIFPCHAYDSSVLHTAKGS